MSNCHNENNGILPFMRAVPCPVPKKQVTKLADDRVSLAVQDGAVPQIITVVDVLPAGPVRTAIAFDRFVVNQIPVFPTTPVPPGTSGSLVVPPGAFTGVAVPKTDFYDITAGLSLLGAAAGLLTGTFTAQVVRFPGGTGTNNPQVIAEIPLTSIAAILAGTIDLPLIRGTVYVPNVLLNAGDVVQIQLVQEAGLIAIDVLAVTYAFLELEI